MMAWLKSTTGMMVAFVTVVLIIIGIWKFNSIKDAVLTRLYNQKTASSVAHGDSAKVEIAAADSTKAQGVEIRSRFNTLVNSPEVRKNPVATRVATEAKGVIANADTEKTHLRAANAQLEKQVKDLENRPDKPIPRTIPYVDILYTKSFTTNRTVPVLRAGVDYRVISFAHAKLEVSYEPPPAPKPGQPTDKPELRLTAGAHLTF